MIRSFQIEIPAPFVPKGVEVFIIMLLKSGDHRPTSIHDTSEIMATQTDSQKNVFLKKE
jgi:hypothetical protein